MDILSFHELDPDLRIQTKWWTLKTYYVTWPKLMMNTYFKNPYLYFYISLGALFLKFFYSLNFLFAILVSFIALISWLTITTYILAVKAIYGDHPENFKEDFDNYFAKEHNALFVAVDRKNPKKVVGCIAMTKEDENEPFYVLRKMRISYKARGSGLANQLMEKAEMFAKENGSSGYILKTTIVQEAAIRLYKRHGCFIEKIDTGFINPGFLPGFQMLIVTMRKNF